jgi:hypothetical protein
MGPVRLAVVCGHLADFVAMWYLLDSDAVEAL